MAAQADASDQAQQANAARADAASQTQQADVARADAASQLQQADVARADAASQMQQADVARADAASQAQQADAARAAAAELQQQINGLQAKVTDRGLVLTLGDVLFTSGSANLNARGDSHLAKLAEFLNKYGSRTALIEGHTDNVGGQDYNLGLSQRRADAVKAYLVNQGIDASRLSASGKGKDSPIADNSTAIGRQENRRVEVIIQNNQVSSL
jgi:outer membrane protein OmpA-like peptidoglycan-associated protein